MPRKKTVNEKLLSSIAQKVSENTGDKYFQSLVKFIAEETEMDYVFIGELLPQKLSVKTIAVCGHGNIIDNFEYMLKHTPCENVIGKEACFYPSNVQKLFRGDTLLADMNIESYVGLPLFASTDTPLGIIVSLSKAPITKADGALLISIMQIFSTRAAAEIERRMAERALVSTERVLREMIDAAPYGAHLYELMADGRLIFSGANGAADRILGIDHRPLIGSTIEEAFPGLVKTDIPAIYMNVAEKGGHFETEHIAYHDNRISGVFEVIAQNIGKNRMAAFFRDVTEKRKLQDLLEESEKRHRLIIEKTGHLVYDYDVASGRIAWSGNITELTGYTPEEFQRTDINEWERMIHPDDREDALKQLGAAMRDLAVYNVEYRFLQKNNSYIYIHDSGVFLADADGKARRMIGIMENITPRKEMDIALRESEERYRNLIKSVTDYIFVVNIRDGVPDSTTHGLRSVAVTGYTPEEYAADSALWLAMVFEPDRPIVLRQIQELLSDKKPHTVEHRIIHKNGGIKWVRNTSVPRFDKEGNFIAYDGLVTDITQQKNAELALHERERFLHNILSSIQDGISVLDADLNIVMVNHTMERLYAHKMPLVGKKCYAAYHGRAEPCLACPSIRTLNAHAPSSEIVPLIGPDGVRGSLELFTFPLVDTSNTTIGVIEYVRDITERTKTEEVMRIKDKAIDTSITGIAFASLDGKLTYVNSAFLNMWGFENAGEVIGRPVIELWESSDDARKLIWNLERTGWWIGEMTARKKDGSQVQVQLSASVVKNEQGEPICLMGSFSDITKRRQAEAEKKRLEEQLQQSQKLEAVGLLAGGIAHDFNNIMTAIIGYASLLKMKIKEDDPLVAKIDDILAVSERAAHLTQGLLAFSRKQASFPRPVRINTIIASIYNIISRIIGEEILIKTELCEHDITVFADPGQLEQVFINLATNARDAMSGGGTLTIRTATAPVNSDFVKQHAPGSEGRYAMISVADTGSGMDEKTLSRIYEPFFTTKEQGKGTGLGLSIVYGIIQQNHGFIDCSSERDRGTTFNIYLPLTSEEPVALEKSGTPQIVKGGETVLVAEDEPMIRKLSESVLTEFGYTVISAVDGIDALEKFTANKDKIKLLLLDVVMPRMNGNEVLAEIKKIKKDIKYLFYSGYSTEILCKKGINDPCNFISKPVSPSELLKKVKEVLARD